MWKQLKELVCIDSPLSDEKVFCVCEGLVFKTAMDVLLILNVIPHIGQYFREKGK